MRFCLLLCFAAAVAFFASCNNAPKKPVEVDAAFIRPTFKSVIGINFIEVKRIFGNGLRFNEMGYELEPSWRLNFMRDDSVKLYSSIKKRYADFHVYFDHDSIFNMADTWLKLRKVNKDSIIFQVLSVGEDRVISKEWSNVYMTFYSDAFMKHLSKADINKLMLPGPRDTAYIHQKALKAKKDNSAVFAAREPVDLLSRSPRLQVEKVKLTDNALNTAPIADEYLYPEFNITIYKAYRDFNYSMSVIVDETGKITFLKSLTGTPSDMQADQDKMMRGIVDGYLKLYLQAVPGTTLNIPHASSIKLNITGYQHDNVPKIKLN